jgi:hypothetical protein
MNVLEVKARVPTAGQKAKERPGQTFGRREARSKAEVKYPVQR